jgi:hypothetical protein
LEKPPWGAEPKMELGPALQQVDALPSDLRRTLTELRRTLTELRPTLTELRCTLSELSRTLEHYFFFYLSSEEALIFVKKINIQ